MMADNNAIRHNEKNEAIQAALEKKAARKALINSIVPYFGLIFIVGFFIIVTQGKFVSADNIGNLINQGFVLIMIAVGSSFVYAHGGMDFSIGAVSGVAQLVCGLLILAGVPLPICILACVAVCVIGASCTAAISLLLSVPVFIGSMTVRTSFTGILKTATTNSDISILFSDYAFMNNTAIKAVILAVVISLGIYLFNYTTIGKYNKALGGNMLTAQQAGVSKNRVIFMAYLLMGTCVGIASVFAFFRAGTVSAYSGNGYEFNIMMAIVLGGFPMTGGEKSRILSAIIGALTVTCLSNGLQLWGLDALLVSGVKGILFVIIVALSYDRSAGKLVS
ncbi:MAG: ABC transporter permease [Clostridiales bacterium]|nr:ABC transporter permease [Clostridiales bacterium]